jgi:hypothetical protein
VAKEIRPTLVKRALDTPMGTPLKSSESTRVDIYVHRLKYSERGMKKVRTPMSLIAKSDGVLTFLFD